MRESKAKTKVLLEYASLLLKLGESAEVVLPDLLESRRIYFLSLLNLPTNQGIFDFLLEYIEFATDFKTLDVLVFHSFNFIFSYP